MAKAKHQCVEEVYLQYGGWCLCSRNGTVFEEHKWWCWQHSPSTKKRRTKAQSAKRAADNAAEERRLQIEQAERAVVEAALAWQQGSVLLAELEMAIRALREAQAA